MRATLPDSKLWLVVSVMGGLLMLAAPDASAQQDAIARCATEATSDARIRCLEEALTANTEGAVSAPGENQIAQDVAAPIRADTPAAESGPTVAVASPPIPPARDEELGHEQVAARQTSTAEDRDQIVERAEFLVASAETVHPGKLRIFLENGQVWQQIQGDEQRIRFDRDSLSAVEIWKSRFGGYKLRISDFKRTIRVRRLR